MTTTPRVVYGTETTNFSSVVVGRTFGTNAPPAGAQQARSALKRYFHYVEGTCRKLEGVLAFCLRCR
jgi:hypothetical protein